MSIAIVVAHLLFIVIWLSIFIKDYELIEKLKKGFENVIGYFKKKKKGVD